MPMELSAILGLLKQALGLILIAPKLLTNLKKTTIPRTKHSHYKELRKRFSKMPFIYRDMEGRLLDDYVNINYGEFHLTDLGFKSNYSSSHIRDSVTKKLSHQLANASRVLILANAGMGKTTFLSYLTVALSLPKKQRVKRELFNIKKRMFPIFIKLKVLDNTQPRPILSYVLSNYNYFRGKRGIKRLIKIAESERLILIIDGYDEIIIPDNANESNIKKDLNGLFDGKPNFNNGEKINADIRKFYRALKHNRIWLSSRKEHYLANRLDYEIKQVNLGRTPQIFTIELFGLVNRLELVKKIFDKYRKSSSFFEDNLSEDVFISYIQRTYEEDVIQLSRNPLFLTIMCYVYIQQFQPEEKAESANKGLISLRELLLICIKLLLKDIDDQKVRGLSKRIKRSLEEQRGLYFTQKLEFLGYFSSQLLQHKPNKGRIVYSKEDIKNLADYYFKNSNNDSTNVEILNSIRQDKMSSIVNQLISQGIFVITDYSKNSILYDFPHLRIREVLAADYFDTIEHIDELIENLDNKNYREFIIFFFQTSTKYTERILKEILDSQGNYQNNYSIELAISCLGNVPLNFNPSQIIEEWIKKIVLSDSNFLVPKELLKHIRVSPNFILWLNKEIDIGFNKNILNSLYFYLSILYNVHQTFFIERIESEFKKIDVKKVQKNDIIQCLILIDPILFIKLFHKYKSNYIELLFNSLVMLNKKLDGKEEWFQKLCNDCNGKELALLFTKANKYYPRLLPKVLGFISLTKISIKDIKSIKIQNNNTQTVYLFSHRINEMISSERMRNGLSNIKESLYEDLSFLSSLTKPSFDEVSKNMYRKYKLEKGEKAQEINIDEFKKNNKASITQEQNNIYTKEIAEINNYILNTMSWDIKKWREFITNL